MQKAGPAVGEHQAVEPLQDFQRLRVVVGAERLGHGRIAFRGQHFQPARALRGVAANIAVALDALGVAQQVAHRGRRLQRHLLAQRAAIGVGVHGHHPVAANRREGRPQRGGDGGFADAALQREHRDAVATPQRPVDLHDQVVVPHDPWAFAHVDQLSGQDVQPATPALRRRRLDLAQQRAGGQLRIRRRRCTAGRLPGVVCAGPGGCPR